MAMASASRCTRVVWRSRVFVALGAACGGGDFAGLPGGRRAQAAAVESRAEGTLVQAGATRLAGGGCRGLRICERQRCGWLWAGVCRFLAAVRGLGTKADDDFPPGLSAA